MLGQVLYRLRVNVLLQDRVELSTEHDDDAGDVEEEEQNQNTAGCTISTAGVRDQQVELEAQDGQDPEQRSHDRAGRDPAERLLDVGTEIVDYGQHERDEDDGQGPAQQVPDQSEDRSQPEEIGQPGTDVPAKDEEDEGRDHQGRREDRQADCGELLADEGTGLFHVVGSIEGLDEGSHPTGTTPEGQNNGCDGTDRDGELIDPPDHALHDLSEEGSGLDGRVLIDQREQRLVKGNAGELVDHRGQGDQEEEKGRDGKDRVVGDLCAKPCELVLLDLPDEHLGQMLEGQVCQPLGDALARCDLPLHTPTPQTG